MLNKKQLLQDLNSQCWFYQKDVFDLDFVQGLKKHFLSQNLNKACVGNEKILNTDVRSDQIHWLNSDDKSKYIQDYFSFINELKNNLNEKFYLGLNEFEGHYARYDKAGFYKPHSDILKEKNKRVLSIITYLNEEWRAEDGGQLRLHLDTHCDIEPLAGSMLCFMSDIVHEVLPTQVSRQAITGWLLRA